MTYQKRDFSERLKELRRVNGFTQEQMASRLYIARSRYQHYESGRAQPSNDMIIKFARVYQMSIEEFVKERLQL